MESIFSLDVEDWFNISAVKSEPDISTWDALPSRVERNFHRMLDIYAKNHVSVTCFFLGYFARRFPQLVKRAVTDGHEVASHGFFHKLAFEQRASEFCEDVRSARLVIEDISGQPVRGYRAPSFSVTEDTPWFFEKLAAAGYGYDSSVFPGPHCIGGLKTRHLHPYVVHSPAGDVIEFPITAVDAFGTLMCFFGGGYLRLFPYFLIKPYAEKVLAEGRPVIFYVHPREIDPEQPRLPMNPKRKFMTYVNLKTTEQKIRNILRDFPVTTYQHYIASHRSEL
jgi:polysaccharide deacetylase family protein (PEP-CTERM system associated)